MRQVDVRQRLLRDLPWIVAITCILQALVVILVFRYGYDSHAYWLAWQHRLYGRAPNTTDAYLYSPAFAQAIWPLSHLSWPAFATIYSLILLASLAWLVKPLPLRLAIPFGLAGLNEVAAGNVFLLFAVVAVLGFRYPATWAFVALTKITPCLGPVWFLVRREWRLLALSLAATTAIGLVSACMAPHLWLDWIHLLATHGGDASGQVGTFIAPPFIARFPVGLALVVWGALGNKRWTVPAAMVIVTPVFGLGAFAMLLALPRLREDPNRTDDEEAVRYERFIRPGTSADKPVLPVLPWRRSRPDSAASDARE